MFLVGGKRKGSELLTGIILCECLAMNTVGTGEVVWSLVTEVDK